MLNTTHSLPWNNEYIIKNISFYSHKAESFAVYIYPRIRIQSAARTVPSDFTGKLDRGVCLGSFPRSSVCVQNWLKTQFFSSDTPLLPASCIAPSISLPATDIKMFCCFKTWFRTAVDSFFFFFSLQAPLGQQPPVTFKKYKDPIASWKQEQGPGNLEATDSRLATSGIF